MKEPTLKGMRILIALPVVIRIEKIYFTKIRIVKIAVKNQFRIPIRSLEADLIFKKVSRKLIMFQL